MAQDSHTQKITRTYPELSGFNLSAEASYLGLKTFLRRAQKIEDAMDHITRLAKSLDLSSLSRPPL